MAKTLAKAQRDRGARPAPPGTQVVRRVAAILKAFSPEQPEWRLTDLAALLDLSKSTAHRLLGALESEGFVEYDPTSHLYRLGVASASLGLQALHGRDLRAVALPILEALAEESRETCTLEILVGRQMLIAMEVLGDYLVNASGSVGTHWPLHATSSGKAVLAALPPSRRDRLLERPLVAWTPSTRTDPQQLLDELARTADRGFAIAIDELEVGYSAVSAAILRKAGEPVAAISIGGPSARLDRHRLGHLGEVLSSSAADLSSRSGFAD